MTINQAIDGVPRELLQKIADGGYCHQGLMDKLRALLDAPTCKRCNGSGWIDNLRPVGTPAMDCPDCKRAAESHTQPVAWRGCNADGEVVTEWIDGVPPERMTDLCGNAARFDKIERAYSERAAQPQGEPTAKSKPVAKLHAERLTGKDGEYGITVEDSQWFNTCRLTGGEFYLYAEQPAPVAVVMSFDFEHPSSKERRTVALSKQDVFDGMEDYFYDKLGQQICRCESVGETNVVDCNCDEYVHDFEIMQSSLKS